MVYVKYNCPYCSNDQAILENSGAHKKLVCAACNLYIKFISKRELLQLSKVDTEDKLDKLNEINFKLDIIIDMLKEKL